MLEAVVEPLAYAGLWSLAVYVGVAVAVFLIAFVWTGDLMFAAAVAPDWPGALVDNLFP